MARVPGVRLRLRNKGGKRGGFSLFGDRTAQRQIRKDPESTKVRRRKARLP